jgi:membrane fusion protein (multidrug efflux system)
MKARNVLKLWAAVTLGTASGFSSAQSAYLPSVGCVIEPSEVIDVSSPVEGVLAKRPAKLGDKVRKGQLLFSLRSGVERASVGLAQTRTEFALRHYDRNEGLYQDELISIHERDEFQTEYQLSLQELEQAKAVLARRSVVSPINGVVIDHFIDPGEFVNEQPVLSIASLNPLKVQLVMPYQSLGSIDVKDSLQIYPVEPVGGSYEAKIYSIDPVIDAASGTYRIHAHIENADGALPAGLECKASLNYPA